MKSLSRVRLFVTPWTAAYQAPPCMGFSRQEYWSGVPLPSSQMLTEHCKMVQPLWKTVWQFLKKSESSNDPILHLGIYSRECKTYVKTKTCIQFFIPVLFRIAKKKKQTSPSADEWINQCGISTQNPTI